MNDEQLLRQLEAATAATPMSDHDGNSETAALREGWAALGQLLSGSHLHDDQAAAQRAIVDRMMSQAEPTTPSALPAWSASAGQPASGRWVALAGMLLVALGIAAVVSMSRRDAPPVSGALMIEPPIKQAVPDHIAGTPTAWHDAFDEQWDDGVAELLDELAAVRSEWKHRDETGIQVGQQLADFHDELTSDAL